MNAHRPLTVALLLDVIGAGGALLISIQTWQRLTTEREGPFPDVQVSMTGRDVDSALTALALVALAGVVAVLATRGVWRRVIGAVVALAGAGLIVRGILSFGPVGNDRALTFIASKRQTVTVRTDAVARIEVTHAWPLLSLGCGALVLAAGALIAVRGGRWQGMSARYERARPAHDPAAVHPADPAEEAAASGRAAATMWSALDRGEDPTAR